MRIVATPTPPDSYIIVVGTPFNGMIPYGPFVTKEAAADWGEKRYPVDEWHIIELEPPELEGASAG